MALATSTNNTFSRTNPFYPPLSTGNGEIRLIELLPARKPTSLVRLRLYSSPLNSAVPYTALSYVWGNPGLTETLSVNGNRVLVTANLHVALRNLRRRRRSSILWIDALCINQKDDQEKSIQVRLMGRIYQQAHTVIAWLGEKEKDSSYALDILKKAALEIRKDQERYPHLYESDNSSPTPSKHDETSEESMFFASQKVELASSKETLNILRDLVDAMRPDIWLRRMPELLTDDPFRHGLFRNRAWDAINNLLQRPYWSRVWIFQEIVLAKSLILRCGDRSISWDDFALASQGFYFHSPTSLCIAKLFSEPLWFLLSASNLFQSVHDLQHDKQQILEGNLKPIFEQIRHLGRLQATDPRDLIYGLLEVSESDIVPDYTKKYEDLFLEFVLDWARWLEMMPHEGSERHPIYSAGIGWNDNQTVDIPSWVPNLSKMKSLSSMWTSALGLYHASGRRWSAMPWKVEGRILHTQGCAQDCVTTTWSTEQFSEDLRSIVGHLAKFTFAQYESREHPTKISILDLLLRTICLDHDVQSQTRLVLGLIGAERAEYLKSHFVHDITEPKVQAMRENGRSEAFIKTMVPRLLGVKGQLKSGREFIHIDNADEFWKLYEMGEMGYDEWLISTRRNVIGATFFVTEKGYLGVGPSLLKEEDVVCIIRGLRLPVLLRPRQGQYEFVGTCFIYGLMDGEGGGDHYHEWISIM